MLSMSQKDPENFFTCNQKWQICSFDFTFRKVMSDSSAYRVRKFNIVDEYFYGENITTNRKIEQIRRQNALKQEDPDYFVKFDDLVVYRGHHICNSQTFMTHLPKMFTSKNEEEVEKLVSLDILTIKKIKHPERQVRFLEKLKEKVKAFQYKEYQMKMRDQAEINKQK